MGKLNFTHNECLKALIALGFIEKTARRGGIHDKYYAPQGLLKAGRRPFVTVPRHAKLRCQAAILQEIRAMGGKELEELFLSYL